MERADHAMVGAAPEVPTMPWLERADYAMVRAALEVPTMPWLERRSRRPILTCCERDSASEML